MQTLTRPHSSETTARSARPMKTAPAVSLRSAAVAKPVSSIPLLIPNTSNPIHIQWLPSGKPVLDGSGLRGVEISLSHDDQACLCVVGPGPQGCDIAPITERTRTNWLALLTAKHGSLLQELIHAGDSLDIAGSRIWAAMEALLKAVGSHVERSLTLEKQEGDSILFSGTAANQSLHILTFPIQFRHGPKRMVAVVVTKQG